MLQLAAAYQVLVVSLPGMVIFPRMVWYGFSCNEGDQRS